MELEIILRVFLAALLGAIIGLERELAQKEAGLRTHILISVGSALFTIISIRLAGQFQGDAGRIASQIVTGVGFIGAGTIIHSRFSIHGLTTAASIWSMAAIGMAVGYGAYLVAFLVSLFVLIVLSLVHWVSKKIDDLQKQYVYLIQTEDQASIMLEVRKILKEMNIKPRNSMLSKYGEEYRYELFFQTSENKSKEFLEKAMMVPGVTRVSWEGL